MQDPQPPPPFRCCSRAPQGWGTTYVDYTRISKHQVIDMKKEELRSIKDFNNWLRGLGWGGKKPVFGHRSSFVWYLRPIGRPTLCCHFFVPFPKRPKMATKCQKSHRKAKKSPKSPKRPQKKLQKTKKTTGNGRRKNVVGGTVEWPKPWERRWLVWYHFLP